MTDAMDTLSVFTAFSGYDSQCLALERLGIPYDLVGWSEIDPFAIRAHNALFPQWEGRNYGDIAAIDWADVPDFGLFTYSFPALLPLTRRLADVMEAYRAARRAASMQGEFCDRCGDDREKCLAIERAIRRLPSRGHISEGTIEMFTLK